MKPIEQRTMTVRERSRLQACETDIDKGGGLILTSLRVIRDERLYRDTHDTFEGYCVERWGMHRMHAHRIIAHGNVLHHLANDPDLYPIGIQIAERATREISELPPEEQVKVVKAVVVDKKEKPTAKAVKAAKEELKATGKISGGTTFDVKEIESASVDVKKPTIPPLLDILGREVPEFFREHCGNAARGSSIGKTLDQACREIDALKGQPGWECLTVQPILHAIKEAKREIMAARFWTTCPRCNGSACDKCHKRGWLSYAVRGQLSDDDKAKLGIE